MADSRALITTPVPRPILPPLVHARTVERGLSQHRVDLVVRLAEPRGERRARAHVRRAVAHAVAEVARAVRARVELREGVQELQHVRALRRRRGVGVVRRSGVQERPRRAAERLDVRRTGRCPSSSSSVVVVVAFFSKPCGRGSERGRSGGRDGARRAALVAAVFLFCRRCGRRRGRRRSRLLGLGRRGWFPVPEGGADFAGFAVWSEDGAWGERAGGMSRACRFPS